MARIIEGNDGVIGDFIGDAIMAFWNSPRQTLNHEVVAVNCALKMTSRLYKLNEIWAKKGLPNIGIRIGIATGKVLTGTMGSPERMKFGVVGDVVNLAARLESLNRVYETRIMVNNATMEEINKVAPNRFLTRQLDKVTVKGRVSAENVFEILSPRYYASQLPDVQDDNFLPSEAASPPQPPPQLPQQPQQQDPVGAAGVGAAEVAGNRGSVSSSSDPHGTPRFQPGTPSLGAENSIVCQRVRRMCDLYNEIYRLYTAAQFEECVEQCNRLLKDFPNDGPTKVILGRCKEYLVSPPPEDWDGVFVPKTK